MALNTTPEEASQLSTALSTLQDPTVPSSQRLPLMRRLVRHYEGSQLWDRDHVISLPTAFFCDLCDEHLDSPHAVVVHVMDSAHQQLLDIREKIYAIKSRSHRERIEMMWDLVQQVDGSDDYVDLEIGFKSDVFYCNVCEETLCGALEVVKHVHGRKHRDIVMRDVKRLL